jgi:transporter family-2 protein
MQLDLVLVPVALLVGGLLAVQAAANLQLSTAVGSPVGAATLQLGLAAALLAAVAALAGALSVLDLLPGVERWHLLGGLGSALYITAGILLFPRLGALVSVGLFVAGQMLASVALDTLGLLGVPRTGPTVAGAVGAVAVVAGMAVIVRAQAHPARRPAGDPVPVAAGRAAAGRAAAGRAGTAPSGPAAANSSTPNRARWTLLGLAAGAALPLQGAVNAQLRADLDAPAAVGAVSFVVATVTMAVVLLAAVGLGRVPRPRLGALGRLPWWGWLGGAVGATYVVAVFLLLPEIGAAATVGLTVAGQQVASALVDQFGLLRLPRRPLSGPRLAGVLLLLAGVGLVQLA